MITRRDFIKGVAVAGILPKEFTNLFPDDIAQTESKAPQYHSYRDIILTEGCNEKMISLLKDIAADMCCCLKCGEPFSPDFLAYPGFVNVLDRRQIGMDLWKAYIEVREEGGDADPFVSIIVDDLKGWPEPSNKPLHSFNPDDPASLLQMKLLIAKTFNDQNA